MCGRLNLHDGRKIEQALRAQGILAYRAGEPRYNVAPGSWVEVLYGGGSVAPMEWGIEFGDFRHPNSKAETIRRQPRLQRLLLAQRCLVPVNRFYEWPDAAVRPRYKGIKTRFCIHTPADVMFLGGLYRISDSGVMQFNVITTDPNAAINDFHHRMPVIVRPDDLGRWFAGASLPELEPLLGPYAGPLEIYPCDAWVDNGRHEGPRCMAPAAGAGA